MPTPPRERKPRLGVRLSCDTFLTSFSLKVDFYNYFQHGIDFFISSSAHVVKKVILHTNVVCLLYVFFCNPQINKVSLVRLYSNDINDVAGRLRGSPKMMKMVSWLLGFPVVCLTCDTIDTPPRKRFYDRVSFITFHLSNASSE